MGRMDNDFEAMQKMANFGSDYCKRIAFFDQFHLDGDPDGFVCVGEWIFFADGAVREKSVGFSTPLEDVPKDPMEATKRILIFTEARLKLSREEFEVFKNKLKQKCWQIESQGNCNRPTKPPTGDDINALKLLQIKVNKWQRKLAAARKKQQGLTPKHIIERNEYCEENRCKTAEVLNEIEKIEI
jgi:hypothetical protein